MKTESMLDDLIDEDTRELLQRHTMTETTSFTDLVREFGLDPRVDFRDADLSGVDFSDSDLRDFDFTGSDLSASIGSNVMIGKNTILDKADVAGSVFEYPTLRDRYFRENPAAAKLLKSMRQEYWAKTISWVADRTAKGAKASHEALEIANAIFFESTDPFLKTNMLYFMSRGFDDRDSYLAFLLQTLNKDYEEENIRRSSLKLLASMFYNKRAAYEIFKKEVRVSIGLDQKRALIAIVRSDFERKERDAMIDLVRKYAGDGNRKYFAQLLIAKKGEEFRRLLSERYFAHYVDLSAEIPEVVLRSVARSWLRKDKVRSDRYTVFRKTEALASEPDDTEIEQRLHRIHRMLEELRAEGLDLVPGPFIPRDTLHAHGF